MTAWLGGIIVAMTRMGMLAGMGLLALMAGLVVLQVLARNFADTGLPWADELARFSCIGLVYIAVPALAGRKIMVSVTILPDALPQAARRWMRLIADLATLCFSGLLLWSFAEFLPKAGKFLTPAMRLPNWVYYSLALTGSIMLALVVLYRVFRAFGGIDPTDDFGGAGEDPTVPSS